MCKTSERVTRLLEPFQKDPRLTGSFQPGIKRDGATAVAWANLNPKEGLAPELYKDVVAAVEAGLRKSVLDCGEIQTVEGSGENVDLGMRHALVVQGKYFEVYCFNCLSAVFARVLLEEGVTKDKRGKQWVSVDVDEVGNSLWFK